MQVRELPDEHPITSALNPGGESRFFKALLQKNAAHSFLSRGQFLLTTTLRTLRSR